MKGGGAQGTGCRHGRGTHEGVGSACARGQATKPSQPSYSPTPARHAGGVLRLCGGGVGGRGRHGRNGQAALVFGLLVCCSFLNVWLAERRVDLLDCGNYPQSVVNDAMACVWAWCVLYWGRRRGGENEGQVVEGDDTPIDDDGTRRRSEEALQEEEWRRRKRSRRLEIQLVDLPNPRTQEVDAT